MLSLLAPGVSAAQEESSPEETGHLSEHGHHDNTIGFFLGLATEEAGSRENGVALGIEYERRLSRQFGIGAIGFIVTGWDDHRLPAGNLGYVSLVGFALIAPVTVLTAPIGARIAHAFDEKRLTFAFGAFLIVISIRLYLRAFAA